MNEENDLSGLDFAVDMMRNPSPQQFKDEVRRLESELAKARELLNVSYQLLGLNNSLVSYRQHMEDIGVFMPKQPEPAAKEDSIKVCECGPLRNITEGGHFPACTRCHRRLEA